MANPFLSKSPRDIETALLLEKAVVTDIGKAVAYTDGDKVYVNTDNNLFDILPAYCEEMLKWLLWHEETHLNLSHHNRFFKYLKELDEAETLKEFQVTKSEVNIIMDILVHDWMADKFPELVEVAKLNLAQFRNRNSLKYTFKTFTLEEMLNEYKEYKKESSDKSEETEGKSEKSEETGETEETEETKEKSAKRRRKKSEEGGETKGHAEGGEEETAEEVPASEDKSEQPDEHDEADWTKLEDREDKEFITKEESEEIDRAVERLKRKKIRLARVTEALNGLVTTTRQRTYKMPSTIYVGSGVLLKGSTPGKAPLYLVFDASGSMSSDMEMFKEIISNSIPQAMHTPCEWFAGGCSPIPAYKKEGWNGYYKGTFEDFLEVYASSGYDDDGDRTIELCWQAEQKGYNPIGITDGGGRLDWSKDKLKQLKRTILVGDSEKWLNRVKEVNPTIQTICTR